MSDRRAGDERHRGRAENVRVALDQVSVEHGHVGHDDPAGTLARSAADAGQGFRRTPRCCSRTRTRSYGAWMKHLHYDSLVIAISNQLAQTIEYAATELMQEGRYAVWPVAGYRDERDEVSVQLAFGPGLRFAITETWLPDERDDARHTADSIAYIEGERQALENAVMARTPENVVIYGRFEKERRSEGTWAFSGIEGVSAAESPGEAVQLLNENGYEVVSVTESGSPGDALAWSNMYIFGRWVR